MKKVKVNLPDGVKKKNITKIGKKVQLLNIKYYPIGGKKKKKTVE